MVDIWGALSSYQSQFHLQASWRSLHTPARRPWNCKCFNKRRTPEGERVIDRLGRIPGGEWLYDVHWISKNTKGEERFHLGMPCSLPTCSTHLESMPSLVSSLLPGFSHQAGSTCEENRLRAELKNEDKYANYLQDLSSFINAVQGVSVGS